VHDPDPEQRVRMDFFFWAAISPKRSVVIDTGCSQKRLQEMRHETIGDPLAALAALGIERGKVEDLVITHLHYDHVGNADQFPNATMHLQQKEMEFVTGPYMRFHCFRRPYFVSDIDYVVHQMHAGRVHQYDGTRQIAPGLSVHLVGGHTPGMQVVRIRTARGWIVLASDALHYYREIEHDLPWSSNAFNVAEMLDAHDTIRNLADSSDHVVPAHDPLVLEKYPAASETLGGQVARLHERPAATQSL
jgi:glyoxylase-like metal-dependent hydrolase (beta-lactamase superfamily II)